jgi:hypothetical protein
MHGYGDLALLAEIPAKLLLVTSGFRRLQESKIEALSSPISSRRSTLMPLTNLAPKANSKPSKP